jgi:quinol monooxygenase YgiN
MSVGILVDIHLKPGGADKWTESLAERIPQTREKDGCESIYLGIDGDDPDHLMIVHRWASKEAYEAYVAWSMAQPGSAELMGYVDGEMKMTFLRDAGI